MYKNWFKGSTSLPLINHDLQLHERNYDGVLAFFYGSLALKIQKKAADEKLTVVQADQVGEKAS